MNFVEGGEYVNVGKTSVTKKDTDAIKPNEIAETRNRIWIGDKIAFSRKRSGCFDYEDDVYKGIKGKVIIMADHFFVIDTGNWRVSYRWTDLLTEGAVVKVNGRIFVR